VSFFFMTSILSDAICLGRQNGIEFRIVKEVI